MGFHKNVYMKKLDKPSHIGGESLLNIEENSDVPCNLLSVSVLPECLESADALFCSGVFGVPAELTQD